MTRALQPASSLGPLMRDMVDRALDPYLLVGMPHLTPNGLSETWLMKELGHRHWLMLSRELGMQSADFRTACGAEAYAAICATSLNAPGFGIVKANDILMIHSRIAPVSMTQTSTTHELFLEDQRIGDVELISTFVHREVAGSNHSIARVAVRKSRPQPFRISHLAKTAADIRNRRIEHHWGLPLDRNDVSRTFRFEPSPSQEFNGAGLFYFAEFQALADRALEVWFPDKIPTTRREVYFLGNIDQNENVCFEIVGCCEKNETIHGQLKRETGKIIATMFIASGETATGRDETSRPI
ncbi:Pnap_2097 family protein [Pararhizobium antarcticum]|uniref:DNA gyrase n=1 Tax=Pararhizobium antarcticum TaxID=1798805 RepID=A0A657LQF6_9HYPH|nr:Pnap_2097 family protein [Pararhizobium antarcticum]OJF93783.1 DNA gyrase [Pararhizobium antarcticum]OJF96254.1 DNA gyrase [Rhizobium sp. 58]